ncbi:MAG: hypothetical protein BGO26_07690 [Actinobacteria bacterium 69-20]|nr:sucrase ferredoxin [Actinomycetota bacterium]OJV30224.1 MAG: hypothetical protein BGO26_07690 [Actinobacteria bacterium 69-20]
MTASPTAQSPAAQSATTPSAATAPPAAAPCCDADRAAGDSPIGSAPSFDTFLLLDHRSPWSRTAADDAVRGLLPRAVQHALAASPRTRAFAVRPVRDRHRVPLQAPRAGRVGHDPFLATFPGGLDATAIAGLATGATAVDGSMVEDIVIGVCTNAKRDRCCAVRGRPVAAALRTTFGQRVTEISHLGGHRFAATMLVLPIGYSYGQLTPDLADAVVRAALDGLVHPTGLRGRSDLSPAAQAADAYWRVALGPSAVDAVRIESETRVDGAVRVTATVQGSRDDVVVRYVAGARIEETTCGGKPIQTGRWSVARA